MYSMDPAWIILGSASTSGTPSYTYITVDAGDTVIRAFADLDGDGTENPVAYTLELSCSPPSAVAYMRFWGAEVEWSRTISPAPDTATLPDVPTSFWAFQYVEALVASGITAGQPDGNYHPTDPVTRAQMATFLA